MHRTCMRATIRDARVLRALSLFVLTTALVTAAVVTPRGHIASASASPTSVRAAGGIAAAGDASETPTASVMPLSGVVRPPAKGAYLGVFRPPAPYKAGALDSYKTLARKPASMVMWFQPWSATGANRFDTAMAVSVWKRGAIPIVTWEPWSPGSTPHNLKYPSDMPEWRMKNIIAGNYDAYITSFALDVKAAGGPVMISLFHEMNGCWYPWGGTVNGNKPAEVVAAWRHVHDIFTRNGVTNVSWIWSVNLRSRPDNSANRYAAYYPGNAYVDWVGVSGFNWGKGVGGGPWMTFEQLDAQPLKYLKRTHKPVMITEIASVGNGGNKAAWLATTFRRIRTAHPEVKAVIYYDAKEYSHKHTQDWRINSSKSSLSAYRKAVSPSYFVGSQPAALTSWRSKLSQEQWSTLLATKQLY